MRQHWVDVRTAETSQCSVQSDACGAGGTGTRGSGAHHDGEQDARDDADDGENNKAENRAEELAAAIALGPAGLVLDSPNGVAAVGAGSDHAVAASASGVVPCGGRRILLVGVGGVSGGGVGVLRLVVGVLGVAVGRVLGMRVRIVVRGVVGHGGRTAGEGEVVVRSRTGRAMRAAGAV